MDHGPAPTTETEAAARLIRLPDAGAGEGSWEARIAGLAGLVAWAAAGRGPERLAAVASACRTNPDAAARLRAAVLALAEGSRSLSLLSEGGLPGRLTLAEETLIRAVRTVVPPVRESRDLADVVGTIFGKPAVAAWLGALSPEALGEVAEAAGLAAGGLWPRLRLHLAEAVRVQSVECAAVGLAGDVRRALGDPPVADSPYHRLASASAGLLDALRASPPDEERAAAARAALAEALAGAQVQRKAVIAHLEETGVSMDLVRRLEFLRKGLGRIGRAAPLLAPRPGEGAAAAGGSLLQMVVADLRREASLGNMVRERSRLLAKKIAERTGRAGTHYVTSSRAEWRRMLGMGLGGGLVMAAAIAVKGSIYHLHPPPFWLSLLVFLDYSAAFLAIFALHWTLATKQPPATAAAFADSLTAMEKGNSAQPVVELLARIARSQFAGLLGNVLGVAAAGFLLDLGWLAWTGSHLFEAGESERTLRAHHPFLSPSLPLAVLTGGAVWLSSMAAGWAEDAAAYGRLQEGLDGDGAGRARGGFLTRWAVRNVSGVVGNVSLAFFLVVLSFTGKVTGLPVDVRHVTVSAGSVALSCLSLGDYMTREVAWAAAGVMFIGLLNIATGFAISLRVALRSRNAGVGARIRLLEALFTAPLGNPLRFVIPVGPDPPPGTRER